MDRYLKQPIRELLGRKIVLLSGPRQVGKTTLARDLSESLAYYNYDIKRDLQVFTRQEWDRKARLVVFDELHKMRKWKLWLKGLYDEGATEKQAIVVTGSARLDIARKMGDSLAGRFFSFRLNPLDLKELKPRGDAEESYRRLLSVGGFPEPFLNGSERFYRLWRRTHLDLILRQDLIYFEAIRDLDGIELLVELLAQRVGSTISVKSLAEDLHRDDKTVARWLRALENMYVVFRVSPYSKNIARGIKKAGKYYFYDLGKVEGDEACKLENLVALSLKKELEFNEDVWGIPGQLHFVQTKEKREIDFLVQRRGFDPLLIEVKLSETQPSRNFGLFERYFPKSAKVQLVRHLSRRFSTPAGVQVENVVDYLSDLQLR
ncbi:MAG: ATP-binding protein [Oligoflexia bacterium]|nr:ATP-binding protein [Oligoflexia bacterium]